MTVTVLLILFAAIALALFVLRAVTVGYGATDEAELSKMIRPVDVEAFRNLMDPSEEDFLRQSLQRSAFRSIQRERLQAAREYLGGVSHNAGVLLQLGQAARGSTDARIAAAARHLVEEASRLRIYATLARGKLYLRFVFPEARVQAAGVIARYQQATEDAVQLGHLRVPGRAALLTRS